MATSARVRNTYAIYLVLGHNFEKSWLIPHKTIEWHHLVVKAQAVQDEHASN
jgi:hypothetical protein